MTSAIIELVLGVILLAVGLWWWTVMGPSFAFLAPTILAGVGGALIVAAIATFLDVKSPTSRKL